MRGIRPYYNKFRAYVVDSQGNHHQEYFDNEALAKEFILKHRPLNIGNSKFKKRSNALCDLPVGLFKVVKRKHTLHGVTETPTIVATVVVNGKAKTKSAAFGTHRTKDEAIKICMKWRTELLAKMHKLITED